MILRLTACSTKTFVTLRKLLTSNYYKRGTNKRKVQKHGYFRLLVSKKRGAHMLLDSSNLASCSFVHGSIPIYSGSIDYDGLGPVSWWLKSLTGGHSDSGNSRIEDPHIVDVDGKLFSARHILISVGERPFIRDISGSEYAIDSDAALDLPSKPEKIAICWWWIHCLGISWHLQWSKK
ncbi:hypothetical protein WN943_016861 [Citrus x changshan-huyou]